MRFFSKREHLKKPNLKKGATSIIATVFTIILFSIITIGFTRLILSEVLQTTNTSLSKSAYDSALAGVEDAKIALLKYHDCLNKGYNATSPGECGRIISFMQDGIRKQDCSTVANVLSRTTVTASLFVAHPRIYHLSYTLPR